MMFQYVGFFTFIALFTYDREALRIDWLAVSKFMAFLIILTLVKMCLIYGEALTPFNIQPKQLLLVGLEDMAFGATLYLAQKYVNLNKYWFGALAVISSLFFGYGHLGYGIPWAIAMTFVPYFVFLKNGKKYGFGTTMVCHFAFDAMTIFMTKFMMVLFLGVV